MGKFTVGLVPHPTKSVLDSVEIIRGWTTRSQAHLVAMTSDAARVGDGVELVDERTFRERVTVVVALGGDGTMLGAMRLVAERPAVPPGARRSPARERRRFRMEQPAEVRRRVRPGGHRPRDRPDRGWGGGLETIFGLPGMGRFMLDAITQRDYPVVQGLNLVLASTIVLINLLVDMTYAYLDPRIRYR